MEDSRERGSYFLRIIAELAVVFVGVSAAFVVDNYRDGREALQRADQLASALYRDLTHFSAASVEYVKGIQGGLDAFRQAVAAGKRPAPFVLRVSGAEGAPTEVWEAAMQSGAGDVLDPELVIELATLYHEIGGETSKYIRYAEFTERQVWPLMISDTTAFYDRGSG